MELLQLLIKVIYISYIERQSHHVEKVWLIHLQTTLVQKILTVKWTKARLKFEDIQCLRLIIIVNTES